MLFLSHLIFSHGSKHLPADKLAAKARQNAGASNELALAHTIQLIPLMIAKLHAVHHPLNLAYASWVVM